MNITKKPKNKTFQLYDFDGKSLSKRECFLGSVVALRFILLKEGVVKWIENGKTAYGIDSNEEVKIKSVELY